MSESCAPEPRPDPGPFTDGRSLRRSFFMGRRLGSKTSVSHQSSGPCLANCVVLPLLKDVEHLIHFSPFLLYPMSCSLSFLKRERKKINCPRSSGYGDHTLIAPFLKCKRALPAVAHCFSAPLYLQEAAIFTAETELKKEI